MLEVLVLIFVFCVGFIFGAVWRAIHEPVEADESSSCGYKF